MVSHCRKTLELCLLTGNYLGLPSLPKGVVARCKTENQKNWEIRCSQTLMHKPLLNNTPEQFLTPLREDSWHPEQAPPRRPCQRMPSGCSLFPRSSGKQFFPSSYQAAPWGLLACCGHHLQKNKAQDTIPSPQSIAGLMTRGSPHHVGWHRTSITWASLGLMRGPCPLGWIRWSWGCPLFQVLLHSAHVRIKTRPLTQLGDCESSPGQSLREGSTEENMARGFQPAIWEDPYFMGG